CPSPSPAPTRHPRPCTWLWCRTGSSPAAATGNPPSGTAVTPKSRSAQGPTWANWTKAPTACGSRSPQPTKNPSSRRVRSVSPEIFVLLPSRGRPGPLVESVASLRELADDPARIEVLVAVDPDDPDTAQAARDCEAEAWRAPERFGYARLHEYVNALAHQAGGDWMLLWNDDARMRTRGWDSRIL